jgi:thiol-disulfide isomerase/thioredoxin
MREPPRTLSPDVSTGVIALVAVLIAATAFGTVWRRRQGRMRVVAAPAAGGHQALTAADLRHDLGARATLVQFSSAFCAPCRATRQILAEVAGMVDGVTHVEIDAESRLDLVRRLNIFSTPSVVVLAADGRIVRQASGQPRKADVIAALGEMPGWDQTARRVAAELSIKTVDNATYTVRAGSDSRADPA